ncbi:MAG: hypothetical protein V7609_1204 [Verrucomicrobiota bacterium]
MISPESRALQQCTYTPSAAPPRSSGPLGASPSHLVLKQALLHQVLGNPSDSHAGINELRKASDALPFRELAEAWATAGAKGTEALAPLLRNTPLAEIIQFGNAALNTEESVVERARHDMESIMEKMNLARTTQIAPGALQSVFFQQATGKKTGGMVGSGVGAEIRWQDVMSQLPALLTNLQTLNPKVDQTALAPDALAAIFGNLEIRTGQIEVRRTRLLRLADLMHAEPIGFLRVERLLFTPVGYALGDLMYSLPMLPGETVRLTHREFARTETEIIKLVTTSLETATQDTLSETSELAQSTGTQRQYSSAFSASATASGGFGPVNVSASAQFGINNSESVAQQTSIKRSREITREASSRAKQEHKISFRVSTQYEVEDNSFRELRNMSERAIRWDFHRLMKKWRVQLFRTDARMTYDLVIPEPGSYLLRKYIRRQRLAQGAAKPLEFIETPAVITPQRIAELTAKYRVSLPAPPAPRTLTFHAEQTFSQKQQGQAFLELTWPSGYVYENASVQATDALQNNEAVGLLDSLDGFNKNRLAASVAAGATQYLWKYSYNWGLGRDPIAGQRMELGVTLHVRPSSEALETWQREAYGILLDAARARHEENQQQLQRELADLDADLGYRGDPLLLRKIEKEEIMKGALRWLLGPDFHFYARNLPGSEIGGLDDLELYYDPASDTDPDWSVREEFYQPTLQYGEVIKFLHQAIEWENVITVLYPYFWASPRRWDFKQFLFHPDYTHRNFLRAGAARVVLPIRRDFESAFCSYVETLNPNEQLPNSHPYITAASELQTTQAALERADFAVDGAILTPDAEWTEFTPTGGLDVREGVTLSEPES